MSKSRFYSAMFAFAFMVVSVFAHAAVAVPADGKALYQVSEQANYGHDPAGMVIGGKMVAEKSMHYTRKVASYEFSRYRPYLKTGAGHYQIDMKSRYERQAPKNPQYL